MSGAVLALLAVESAGGSVDVGLEEGSDVDGVRGGPEKTKDANREKRREGERREEGREEVAVS